LTAAEPLIILPVLLIFLRGPSKARLTFRPGMGMYGVSDREQV